ncbi:Protein hook [Frankliniella fusca]|uniref:Protein hook n=1 Tax=Frankliniella fusca TaxID=407009 RepID=A0AAE1L7Z7_9NEOP|nr:Protein hook [Frankliniella fusca]
MVVSLLPSAVHSMPELERNMLKALAVFSLCPFQFLHNGSLPTRNSMFSSRSSLDLQIICHQIWKIKFLEEYINF